MKEFSLTRATELAEEYAAEAEAIALDGRRPPVRTRGLLCPRNAPCPCGGGRKYKHCHRRLEKVCESPSALC